MKTFAKTLRTIFIVVAVVLLIIAAVLYYIDTPVVEEGQEPTLAQKIILLGKERLGEILAATGVSMVGLLAYFAKKIYDSVKKSVNQSLDTDANVKGLYKGYQDLVETVAYLYEVVNTIEQKQDIANNVLMTTFSLSDLPSSLREKISNAQEQYNKLCEVKKVAEQLLSTVKNTISEQSSAVAEEKAVEQETTQPQVDPVYD